MSNEQMSRSVSDGVDLGGTSHIAGADYQLACCTSCCADRNMWVSAAELVYEFTGLPGSVVRNTLSFALDGNDRIDINLLTGDFQMFSGATSSMQGRKGVDLLMKWKGMTLEQALEYITRKYSADHASNMAADFQRMTGGLQATP
jgi:hypothetical protein